MLLEGRFGLTKQLFERDMVGRGGRFVDQFGQSLMLLDFTVDIGTIKIPA